MPSPNSPADRLLLQRGGVNRRATAFNLNRRQDRRWRRWIGWSLFHGVVFTSGAMFQTGQAQSLPQQSPPPAGGREIIELSVNGQALPTLGLPSISLPPVSDRFTVHMKPERPRPRQYRLEGVDPRWKEASGEMAITLRFFNEQGEVLQQDAESLFGETRGWNGSLEKPVFVQQKKTITVPQAHVVFGS